MAMFTFDKIYQPLTARPFLSNQSYSEYQSCKALQPYIACYWVDAEEKKKDGKAIKEVLVIPDTCMDIIIRVNHTKQIINGYLCCIQDQPFLAASGESEDVVTCFAIRFYFWAVNLFFNLNFKNTCNQMIDLADIGCEWKTLFQPFFYLTTVKERITWVENFLLIKLSEIEINPNLFNSIQQILTASGRASVKDICNCSCVSQRQLERLFQQEIGLPLKRISRLVRYQNVWREMVLSEHFDIQDAVCRYHYTDQAHLLNEFKRFHGVSPEEARKIALINRPV